MWSRNIIVFLFGLGLCWKPVLANECPIQPSLFAILPNPYSEYTLINSVDFHPKRNLFCVTYTQTDKVILYNIVDDQLQVSQILSNVSAKLSSPQHAVFSPDGKKLVVANWTNQTLTSYHYKDNSLFSYTPTSSTPCHTSLLNSRAHGIAFSPCGNYLAVAYGVISIFDRAVVLYHFNENSKQGSHFELVSILKNDSIPGIPKGITFSPDGTSLLVTFCDVNSLVIYDIDQKDLTINPVPRQTIQGPDTKIFRPEDVKISPDGNYCAVSNSEEHTVTFYLYDQKMNLISQPTPCSILQNPDARFYFPHGIAFSSDGNFLAVTQFGHVWIAENGGIGWTPDIKPTDSTVNLYRLKKENDSSP